MQRRTKISYLLLLVYVLATLGHNLYFALTGTEESALLIVAMVTFALFVASLVVNVVTYLRKGTPEDVWKLGWVGLLGLLGFVPGFGTGFFGLYGFFGFFGFRNPTSPKGSVRARK